MNLTNLIKDWSKLRARGYKISTAALFLAAANVGLILGFFSGFITLPDWAPTHLAPALTVALFLLANLAALNWDFSRFLAWLAQQADLLEDFDTDYSGFTDDPFKPTQ